MAEAENADHPEADEAIRLMGGPVETARKLDIPKYQAVQSWRQNGIPVRYCRRINELTGLSLQRLRPTDWADYWPEVSGTEGAPEVKASEGV